MKLPDEIFAIKSIVIYLNQHFPVKRGEPNNFVAIRHLKTQKWIVVVRSFPIFYSSNKFKALKTLILSKAGFDLSFRILWDTYVYWNLKDKKGIIIK